jgi:hypothetical protein
MLTMQQNSELTYDLVDENGYVYFTETDLFKAMTEMIKRNRATAKYLAGKAREKRIMEIALSWSMIQVIIEAEAKGLSSDLSVADEVAIRLEMAEVALTKEECKLQVKRPLKRLEE